MLLNVSTFYCYARLPSWTLPFVNVDVSYCIGAKLPIAGKDKDIVENAFSPFACNNDNGCVEEESHLS